MFSNKMVKSKLLFGALVVGLSSNCYALLTDSPPDPTWANIDNSGSPLWVTYTFSGSAVYDPEGGKSNDHSYGTGSFSSSVEIASGWPEYATGVCNPAINDGFADTQCGSKPSAFYYYWNNATPGDTTDDILYMRMRMNESPISPNNYQFKNFHWNFLLDYDGDGFKEVWLDVFGGGLNGSGQTSTLRILYDDNPS